MTDESTKKIHPTEEPPRRGGRDRQEPVRTGGRRVLVVDDDESNRALLELRLRKRGFLVDTAEGGLQGLEMVSASHYDLVLLDVMMPDLGGLEVLGRIRERESVADLPVIMVTAQDRSEDIVAALEAGANDYVTKPLDMPVVAARMAIQLELKQAREQVQQLARDLERAQERIAKLADSTGGALQDVLSWAVGTAEEVARAIASPPITVWVLEGSNWLLATGDTANTPTDEQLQKLLRRRTFLEREGDVLVPAFGLAGSLFGVIVVPDKTLLHEPITMRLVRSFARQLGGAQELKRTREDLATASRRLELRQSEMIERGIRLLRICRHCQRCYDHTVERCRDDGRYLDAPTAFPYVVADRYRLVRILAEGGVGRVYIAHDERLNRDVALKVIKAQHFANDTMRIRFQREALAMAKVAHPNVVAVFDTGEVGEGSQFMVMELLHGQDLNVLLRIEGPGRPHQVSALMRQVAAALDAAHDAGVVHRDIKPANLHLVPAADSFRATVLDFGLAKEVDIAAHLTQSGMILGTPAFMSPEQVRGKPVDHRTDLYSFAAVAYEALVGARVVRKISFGEIAAEIVGQPPPRVSSTLEDATTAIDDAFLRALAKDPAARPERAGEWVESVVEEIEALPDRVPGWFRS